MGKGFLERQLSEPVEPEVPVLLCVFLVLAAAAAWMRVPQSPTAKRPELSDHFGARVAARHVG